MKEHRRRSCGPERAGVTGRAIRRRHRRVPALLPAGLVALLLLSCESTDDAPTLALPERPDDAAGAQTLVHELSGLGFEDREARIYEEVARGNVPDWLRTLQRVEISGTFEGQSRRVTFWVTPDYLALGSDEDYFLVPISPPTAQRIATLANASLPTAHMVDAIWVAARTRLSPIRLPPDETMTTVPSFAHHDDLIRAQRWLRNADPGRFVAGHKIDLVLMDRPAADSAETALYGWHRSDGIPIQPFYPLPPDSRPTFAHGMRLVDRTILLDGVEVDLLEVLRDPSLGAILAGPSTGEAE